MASSSHVSFGGWEHPRAVWVARSGTTRRGIPTPRVDTVALCADLDAGRTLGPVITHGDPPQGVTAALGNARRAPERGRMPLTQVSGRGPEVAAVNEHRDLADDAAGTRHARDRRIPPVMSAGDAEMMTVCAGAVGLDRRVELADPRLDPNLLAVLASRSRGAKDDLEGLRTIWSHHSHRKGI